MHTSSLSLPPAIWPRCVYARAQPIHGLGELKVPKRGERVGFARARGPRAPAPRVAPAEVTRSRVFRDLAYFGSGIGRRSDTTLSPLAPTRDYFPRPRPQTLPMGRFFAPISPARIRRFLDARLGSTLYMQKCPNMLA